MEMQTHSLPLGAAFGALKIAFSTLTAVPKATLRSQTLLYQALQVRLNKINQSPQISAMQKRGLEKWIVEHVR